MNKILKTLKEIASYPSAVVGGVMVLILVAISIYTVIAIPYNEAISLWKSSEQQWFRNPKYAQPAWTNFFRTKKLPTTIDENITAHPENKTVTVRSDGTKTITENFPFDFNFDGFPSDLAIYFTYNYVQKPPFAVVTFVTPDGRKIRLKSSMITDSFRIDQDTALIQKFGNTPPHIALFSVPKSDPAQILKGHYEVQVEIITFEKDTDVDAEFIAYGQVSGIAGTDHKRRDLMIALLWGTPIALMFGLLAAVGTTVAEMIIAAVGSWFGGWLDALINRIVEVIMVIPQLAILIMIGTFYSRSIFVILGSVIVLGIFGAGIKTFRAVFMQTKESAYIDAARAYGASNTRIIFQYMIPRIIPMLIPQFIVLIPSFVFLEASLAVLGLGDPTLPTWGKIIDDARSNGALFQGFYYWVLEPSALLLFTGLAFSMLGFALDRIFNPRLRGQ
jgi:peptide/nickel transport system permease protein